MHAMLVPLANYLGIMDAILSHPNVTPNDTLI